MAPRHLRGAAFDECRQFARGLFPRRPGGQPAEDLQPVRASVGHQILADVVLRRQRDPQIGGRAHIRSGESALGHADDGEGMSVEQHAAADHVRISAERPTPETIADDRYGVRRGRSVVFRRERAAEPRGSTQHVEVVARNELSSHARWLSARGRIQRHRRMSGDTVHEVALGHDPIKRIRESGARLCQDAFIGQIEQFFRMDEGQRPQQDPFDYREDRSVHADPDRQRRCRRHREEGGLSQQSPGVPDVVRQIGQRCEMLHVAICVTDCGHRAKFRHRLTSRVVGVQAGANIVGGLHRKVTGMLLSQSFVIAPQRRGGEPLQEPPHSAQRMSSTLTTKKRPMSAIVCSQFCISVRSRLRPAAVSR